MNVDSLEGALIREVKPGRRSPERRANKLSFFEEITAQQMYTYSPAQIATVLQQRENQHQPSGGTHNLYHPSGHYDGRRLKSSPGPSNPANTKPWVPRTEDCQARYCHHCRPSFRGRSFLSLDGIINGDIPPTAATSFGVQNKPVADVRVVRNIGLRAVPLPKDYDQPHTDRSSYSSLSILDLSDIVGDVLDCRQVQAEVEVEKGSTRDSTPTPSDSEATSFGEGPLEAGDV
ncbi:hypothetical protein FHL15_008701 [Xylaria flabelliformis]|uniref:Uncharacterized protein n=1 Tax=Xylaria flabelliformis TaxID=2512241 RepID=A0A553HQV5_9PEZI|nr:hypothetical protein FHL15_008701 [Xylaria flabelliformis]